MKRNTFCLWLANALLCIGIVVSLVATPARAGTLEWVRQFGTPGLDTFRGLSTDGPGNIYVAGATHNLGPENGVFLRKYDSAGNLQWTRRTESAPNFFVSVEGVSPDGLGNVYISGISAPIFFGPADAYVSKYDASGNLVWTRQLETDESYSSYGVSADRLGNVYISGNTTGSLGAPAAGGQDVFVSKYDASGSFQWIRQLGTSADDLGRGVSADGMGNVYVSGRSGGDAFVSKYDDGGNLQWTRYLDANEGADSFGVLADGLGNVYITGYITTPPAQDAFLAKYDETGAHQWTRQLGSDRASYTEQSHDIAVDGLGNVFIAGATDGSLGAPNPTIGFSDVFVSRYDTAGKYYSTFQFGTTTRDTAYGVSADGIGNLYLAGITEGSLAGGIHVGSIDGFLAKYIIPEPAGWQLACLALCWFGRQRSSRLVRYAN